MATQFPRSPRKHLLLLGAALAAFGPIGCADAQQQPMHAAMPQASMSTVEVGGQPMLPSRNIVENAVNSADHTTLVKAVQAAGLVDTLRGPGPFTVFAPTNEAFAALPAGTVNTLMQPANKAKLQGVLTYHVVPGRLDFAALSERIRQGSGRAMLTTAAGGTLTAMMNGPHNIVLRDAAGHEAHISTYDVYQSNGVIHVIDHVLLPG